MKKTILIIALILPALITFSQTTYYPGGLGSTDLQVWFKADAGINYGTAPDISSWNDQSPVGNDVSQGNTNWRPSYNASFTNGMPGVEFNGSDEWLVTTTSPGNGIFSPDGAMFLVVENQSSGSSWRGMLTQGRDVGPWWGLWTNPNWIFGSLGSNSSGGATGSSPTILSGVQQSGTNNKNIYVNGANMNSHNSISSGNTAQMAVGRALGLNEYFDGLMGEALVYDEYLNNSKRTLVENYLNARYNITISNDKYAQPSATTFTSDLVGIGRESGSDNFTTSGSSGGLIIENSSFLQDNGDYILAAYNGSSVSRDTTSSNISSSTVLRWDNDWFVDVTDVSSNGGDVIITYDFSDFRAGNIGVDTNYQLLYRASTGATNFTEVSGTMISKSGDQVSFTVDARSLLDGYYTLGSSNTKESPLPIELLKFTAVLVNNEYVQLKWTTSSEINNDYFSIERSLNGYEWKEIKRINGAGNSSSLLSYSKVDNNPYDGVSYYRLKQTDFDGQFEYSQIKSVNIEQLVNSKIEVYPNPATNQITIKGNSNELEEIVIYNTLGQNVTSLINQVITNESQVVIDMSKLNTGMYYVKTKTTANKVYKQ